MDHLYQALKELCKAVLNLIIAVLDLFSGVLNGIACLFEHLKFPSGHFQEIHEKGIRTLKFSKETAKTDNDKLQQIRTELRQQITGKDSYIQAYCRTTQKGRQILPVAAVLFAALLSIILLLGMTGISSGTWLALTVVTLTAALILCGIITYTAREGMKNRMILLILENEFSHYLHEEVETDVMQQEETGAISSDTTEKETESSIA